MVIYVIIIKKEKERKRGGPYPNGVRSSDTKTETQWLVNKKNTE